MSLAIAECPYCARAELAGSPAQAPPAAAPAKPPAEPPPPAVGPWAREESPYLRGVRFGVGFMLAVVTLLLLIALLWQWLSAHPEWQPWLGPSR